MLPVDIILDSQHLCNLQSEKQTIKDGIELGEHLVVFGRRNTGKTSLVIGVCVPEFTGKHKKAIAVVADFLGVTDVSDIEARVKRALEKAIAKAFPTQTALKTLIAAIESFRPQVSLDPVTGNLDLSIDLRPSSSKSRLEELIDKINQLSQKFPMVLVFDEFQDLAFTKAGLALMRSQLQRLRPNVPVVILGSKKHLLAKIFAAHRAPLAGWGRDVIVPVVASDEYRKAYFAYVRDEFQKFKHVIELEAFNFLVERVQGIPESINIVCNYILRNKSKCSTKNDINASISGAVNERRGRYEEMFARLRPNERSILIAISKSQPVKHIKSKDFIQKVSDIAPTSILHAVKRLEDLAEIYHTEDGYVVGEPLFGVYLQAIR